MINLKKFQKLKNRSMKSLIRNLFNTKFGIFFRNLFGVRPKYFLIDFSAKELSISDAFFWRTDNNFKTLFKFTNLLSFFYKDKDSHVEIIFYDKNNRFLKKVVKENIILSDELLIDKFFLNGIEDFGVFYIFHKSQKLHNSIIRNSCYVGYSKDNNLASFVHGNLTSAFSDFSGNVITFGIGSMSLFKNQKYIVQNYFADYDKTELLLHNSSNKKIFFLINNVNYKLNTGCSTIIDIGKDNTAHIISNSYLLRPIIINYKSNFIDVYHG